MQMNWANIPKYIMDLIFMEGLLPFQEDKVVRTLNQPFQQEEFYRTELPYQAVNLLAVQVVCKKYVNTQLEQTNTICSASSWTELC